MNNKHLYVGLLLVTSLLHGCGGSSTETPDEQPITGAPPPTIVFSSPSLTVNESGEASISFSTNNAGPGAIIRPLNNPLLNPVVSGQQILLTIPAVDLHTNQTTLSVEVEFGGQKRTSTLTVNIQNTSGLLKVREANDFITYTGVLGEEDLMLASAIKDMAQFENVSFNKEFSSLVSHIRRLPATDEVVEATLLINQALVDYLENNINELAFIIALQDASDALTLTPFTTLHRLMEPFWGYLNDFSANEVLYIEYAPTKNTFSRYIDNDRLGNVTGQTWRFSDKFTYLEEILPIYRGNVPCAMPSTEEGS